MTCPAMLPFFADELWIFVLPKTGISGTIRPDIKHSGAVRTLIPVKRYRDRKESP
jgi:hypothetical protein